MAQRPQRNNNPFAIMQIPPDKWIGLKGSADDGFLSFKTPSDGTRAGFINLINTYLNVGLNTIEKIFPVYAPYGHGSNDPKVYIRVVSKLTGMKPNEIIDTPEKIYKLGRAIVQHEEGKFWVPENDFRDGFNRAMKTKKISIPETFSYLAVFVLMILAYIIFV